MSDDEDDDYIEHVSELNDNVTQGRWKTEEHDLFLQGLNLYGKEWKKIAALVKTRTVVQIRTHAQKYFQKLSKSSSCGSHKRSK